MANKSIISNSGNSGMNPLIFDSQINRLSETLKDAQSKNNKKMVSFNNSYNFSL